MTRAWHKHATIPDLLVSNEWPKVPHRIRWRWTEGDKDFTLGVTKPTVDNTGVTPGTTLTDVTGDVTFSTDDEVVRGKRFLGKVTVRANRVRFYDCYFTGGTPPTDLNVVWCGADTNVSSYVGTLFSRCTFIPTVAQVNQGAAYVGCNTTTHRCLIRGGWVDAVNMQTDTNNVNPGACYSLGDYLEPTIYESDPKQGGGRSHSDCIQVANGRGHTAIGTHFSAVVGDSYSHGVVLSPYANPAIGGFSALYCWFTGGGAQFSPWPNATTDKAPYIPDVRLVGCRFDARGTLNDLSGGVYRPQSILVTPGTLLAGVFKDNWQTYPTTPPSGGVAYGASATPDSPVAAYMYVAKNG